MLRLLLLLPLFASSLAFAQLAITPATLPPGQVGTSYAATPGPPPVDDPLASSVSPDLRFVGESTGTIEFEVDGMEAPAALDPMLGSSDGPEGDGVASAAKPKGQTERQVQSDRSGCPRDMLRAGGVCVDIFEYPNKAGEIPQANVSHPEAAALCKAQERRLCTADEWMGACVGAQETRWPYGDEYDRGACNYGYTGGRGGVVPSGSNRECLSDYGVYDLSGNLWEWVSDIDTEGKAQIFGGYWNLGATYGKCNTVASAAMTFNHMSVGFRCCRDPIDGEQAPAGPG